MFKNELAAQLSLIPLSRKRHPVTCRNAKTASFVFHNPAFGNHRCENRPSRSGHISGHEKKKSRHEIPVPPKPSLHCFSLPQTIGHTRFSFLEQQISMQDTIMVLGQTR